MATIPAFRASFSNLAKAQSTHFRDQVGKDGQLVKGGASAGFSPRRALVALVQNGRVSEGSLAHRMIQRMVGRERFAGMAREMREHKEASLNNLAKLVRSGVEDAMGRDETLESRVSDQLRQLRSQRLSARNIAGVERELANLVAQRREQRLEIADRVLGEGENWIMTPAMAPEEGVQTPLSHMEALVAITAIEHGTSASRAHSDHLRGHAGIETGTDDRWAAMTMRADALVTEMKQVEHELRNPPALRDKQQQLAALTPTDVHGNQTPGGKAETLHAEITGLQEQANARADNFKNRYVQMLEAIYVDTGAVFPMPETVEDAGEPGSDIWREKVAAFGAQDKGIGGVFDGQPGKPLLKPRAGPRQAPAASGDRRNVAWAEQPVRARSVEIRDGEKTHEGDVGAASHKEYNKANRVGKNKAAEDLEQMPELIELMEAGELAPSDEAELVRCFPRVRVALGASDEGKAELARKLSENPLLHPSRVLDYVGNMIYRPSAPHLAADGRPARIGLRGKPLDNAKFSLDRIIKGDGSPQEVERAVNLKRVLLQDVLAEERSAHPRDPVQLNRFRNELETLNERHPPVQDLADKAVQFSHFVDTARHGVDSTLRDFDANVSEQASAAKVTDFLSREAEPGLRKVTTVLQGIVNNGLLHTRNLPAHVLNAPRIGPTPGYVWSNQSDTIRTMAEQVGRASYNLVMPGKFVQYGTSGKDNPYHDVAARFSQHEQGVRTWLRQGVALTERLVAAQEGAGKGAVPLTREELDGLRRDVDAFADSTGSRRN